MPPVDKATTTKKVIKPGARVVSAPRIVLPTEKTRPSVQLKDYISMFFGPPGIGKTTFVNGFSDRVLFLSTDRGTRFLEAMRVECLNWQTFDQVMTELERGMSKNYDFICIDHVDDWANSAETHVLNRLNIEALTDAGYGKGWSILKKELHRYLARIRALDLGIVFIAHEDSRKVKVRGMDVDKVVPLMSKQAWNAIIPLADIVGYCGSKPMKDKAGKRIEVRVLETVPREDLYAKDRISHLRKRPAGRDWEELDGRKFISTFGV